MILWFSFRHDSKSKDAPFKLGSFPCQVVEPEVGCFRKAMAIATASSGAVHVNSSPRLIWLVIGLLLFVVNAAAEEVVISYIHMYIYIYHFSGIWNVWIACKTCGRLTRKRGRSSLYVMSKWRQTSEASTEGHSGSLTHILDLCAATAIPSTMCIWPLKNASMIWPNVGFDSCEGRTS